MISLTPQVWTPSVHEAALKEQQEAEDEALARKIYQEEMQKAGATPQQSTSLADQRDVLAEANALRAARHAEPMSKPSVPLSKRKEPSPALTPTPLLTQAAAAAKPLPLPLASAPAAASQRSLSEQLEDVRRQRRGDWRDR